MTKKSDNLKEISTPEQVAQAVQDLEKQGIDTSQIARSIRIAPSKRVVLQMPKNILLKHNALIFHKASSLSSSQRKMVQDRVAYGLSKGTIKPEDVAKEINQLNALIQGELIKSIDNASIQSEEEE